MGRIGCIAGRGDWNWGSDATGGCYLRYAEKRITYHTLCDNLCCKIASEDEILVLLVARCIK